jgi:alkyl sulfatase BDS1-like metallo-beta-lactamase superfamily hydrolase
MAMNHEDYLLTSKGFLARLERPVVIKRENGTPVFDLAAFDFIAENPTSPPDTVNPSLWRQSFLHTKDGLFEGSLFCLLLLFLSLSLCLCLCHSWPSPFLPTRPVVCDGIYQVRNYDVANITFIRGEKGWLVIDPLTSTETAKACLTLVNETLGFRPVTGVHIEMYINIDIVRES